MKEIILGLFVFLLVPFNLTVFSIGDELNKDELTKLIRTHFPSARCEFSASRYTTLVPEKVNDIWEKDFQNEIFKSNPQEREYPSLMAIAVKRSIRQQAAFGITLLDNGIEEECFTCSFFISPDIYLEAENEKIHERVINIHFFNSKDGQEFNVSKDNEIKINGRMYKPEWFMLS